MLGEVQIRDVTFGLFPKVGAMMEEALNSWPENSVGDVLDMMLQSLEVFLHL